MNEQDINVPAEDPFNRPLRRFEKKIMLSGMKKAYLFTLLFFIAYFLIDLLIMPLYTRHWQAITVPDVMYLSYAAASKTLDNEGLLVVKAEEKYDENYPPGFVLFQNPEQGSTVKKGRRIYLTIGKGFRVFEMPKLIGTAERDAHFILQEHNLVVGKISYGLDSFYPEGVVIGQSRQPEEDVTQGETIDIVVSLGVESSTFIVPDLVGKSLEEAKAAIQRVGMEIKQIRYEIFDQLLPNTVVEQSIPPGMQVQIGDGIDLVVSRLSNQAHED